MAVPDRNYNLLTINFRDYADKPSHSSFRVSDAAAGAWIADTSTGLIHALTQAVNDVSDGHITSISLTRHYDIVDSNTPSTVVTAYNSSVLLILNQETGGERDSGRNRIPARKDSVLGAVNGIVPTAVDPTTEVAALIAAYNAVVLSEEDQPTAVVAMKAVGRSESV